jgi:serine/threonine protein kinase
MVGQMSASDHMLGKYRLIAEIGRGGMAVVYLAVAQGMARVHKLLVVKELLPTFAEDPRYIQMFLSEARLAARLAHPNIVQTIEIGQEGNRYYIVMEYLAGQSLSAVLTRSNKNASQFPMQIRLRLISEALTALHYLHELQDYGGTKLDIVHRDVSPHNIFVTYDGVAKLMDFGVAKGASSGPESVVGKAQYMAPEQARGERVDRRADVFSVGVILWEAVARRRLWKKTTTEDIFRSLIKRTPLPTLRSVVPDVPDELEAICQRALEFDRGYRYADCQAFQEDLDRFTESLPGGSTSMREVARFVGELFSSTRQRTDAAIFERLHQLETSGDLSLDVLAPPSLRSDQELPGRIPEATTEPPPERPVRPPEMPTVTPVTPTPMPALAPLIPVLSKLNEVPGIVGSAVLDPQGRLMSFVFPGKDLAAIRTMLGVLQQCFDMLTPVEKLPTPKQQAQFRFQRLQLVWRRTEDAIFLVCATDKLNFNVLTVALNAARLKIPAALNPKQAPAGPPAPQMERLMDPTISLYATMSAAPLTNTSARASPPAAPPRPATAAGAGAVATVPLPQAAETLKAVAAALAKQVGPMAMVVIRRAMTELGVSTETIRPEQLSQLITTASLAIGDPRQRTQFAEDARRAAKL